MPSPHIQHMYVHDWQSFQERKYIGQLQATLVVEIATLPQVAALLPGAGAVAGDPEHAGSGGASAAGAPQGAAEAVAGMQAPSAGDVPASAARAPPASAAVVLESGTADAAASSAVLTAQRHSRGICAAKRSTLQAKSAAVHTHCAR